MKKKLLAGLMVISMLIMVVGCGKKASESTETSAYKNALEALNAVWNSYDAGMPVYGGSIESNVPDAPGTLALSDKGAMTSTLLIPEDMQGKVTDAATVIHMMNTNTFTGVALKLDGISLSDAADAMKESFLANPFVCSIPDKMVIYSVDGYLLYAYGAAEIVDEFAAACAKMDKSKELVNQNYM